MRQITTRQFLSALNTCASVAFVMSCPAWASTAFDFSNQTGNAGGGMGNSLTLTSGSLTTTETAWWLNTSSPASGTHFQRAEVDAYQGYGLGVCDSAEGSGCGSPQHQI